MARWYETGGLFADDTRIRCSDCEFDLYDCVHGGSANIEKFKYCPNCGRKIEQKIKMSFKIHSAEINRRNKYRRYGKNQGRSSRL